MSGVVTAHAPKVLVSAPGQVNSHRRDNRPGCYDPSERMQHMTSVSPDPERTDAAFDRLYEQALLENNDTARYTLYRRMDQMVIDAAPIVPLWYDEVIRMVDPRVKGFRPNALNLLELRKVDLLTPAKR